MLSSRLPVMTTGVSPSLIFSPQHELSLMQNSVWTLAAPSYELSHFAPETLFPNYSRFAATSAYGFHPVAEAMTSDNPLLIAGGEETVAMEGGRKYLPVPRTLVQAIKEYFVYGSGNDVERESLFVDQLERFEKEYDGKLKKAAQPPAAPPPPPEKSRKEKLLPLHEVFLQNDVMDLCIASTGIPELLDGKGSKNNGVILNGPPGTGKTVLLRAIAKVYENCGAYAVEISESAISDKFVGSKAKNLETMIQKALEEAKKRGKPSFIYLDEASTSVSKPDDGSNVKSYYQEAIDTLKRYIGNYPELVFAISTNVESEVMDDAIIREGRLRVIRVDRPGLDEKMKMWNHFLKKYGVIENLTQEQVETLAKTFPEESQGAAIELFCRTYLDNLVLAERKARNQTALLEALENDVAISVDDVRGQISYERVLSDLRKVVDLKAAGKPVEKPRRKVGFDRPENAELDRQLDAKKKAA